MLTFTVAPGASWDAVYFADVGLADASGTLRNVSDMRLVPTAATELRAVALRRLFDGDVGWVEPPPPGLDGAAPRGRWAGRVSFGAPCWLPPHPCRTVPGLGPEPARR
jgi:hypothetical protein